MYYQLSRPALSMPKISQKIYIFAENVFTTHGGLSALCRRISRAFLYVKNVKSKTMFESRKSDTSSENRFKSNLVT